MSYISDKNTALGCHSCPAHQIGDSFNFFPILLTKIQQKDKPGTNTSRIEFEVELVNTGNVFIDFESETDRLKAVLSKDDIAKGSKNSIKKKLNTEEEKCEFM